MKKYLLSLAALSSMLLSGCMVVGVSNIGNKILEKQIEIDAAILPDATAFYQTDEAEYIEVPIQTFRESYPWASMIAGEVHTLSYNRYYPLSPLQQKKVLLCRKKNKGTRWDHWEVVNALPKNVVPMEKPQDWFTRGGSEKYIPRYLLADVTKRDNNSIWRKTGAVSCMILLDFPLTVIYSCTLITAIPAAITAY